MHRHVKQPGESYVVGIDFATVPLASGVTVAGGVVSARDAQGDDATAAVLDGAPIATQTLLLIRLKQDGPAGTYTLTFKADTSAGDRFEEDLPLTVKEL